MDFGEFEGVEPSEAFGLEVSVKWSGSGWSVKGVAVTQSGTKEIAPRDRRDEVLCSEDDRRHAKGVANPVPAWRFLQASENTPFLLVFRVMGSGWFDMSSCRSCGLRRSCNTTRCVPSPTMRTDELDFDLPESLIATTPASPRDSSRLLVVSKSDPEYLQDRVFTDLPGLLMPDDLLVFNRSSVMPARFCGRNLQTGGAVEGLYLCDGPGSSPGRLLWVALVKTKRPRVGRRIGLVDAQGRATRFVAEFIEPHPEEGPGAWVLLIQGIDGEGSEGVVGRSRGVLDVVGGTPLPPYIVSQRKHRDELVDDAVDRASYQTMYADLNDSGSVAAPTAGLHFTDRIMDGLKDRAVSTAEVVLHVGAGTFKPIDADRLEDHDMHAERCSMGSAADLFKDGKPGSRRVFAVGSTSARTLESYAGVHESGGAIDGSMDTQILIRPGYDWRWVDGMVTNFHLPRSTLIAMVASMLDVPGEASGIDRVKSIYAHAIHKEYRFFSYGDAMLILP